MLTRLRVSGFKNLVDLDVRFGPFTCVAGPNGVGKSNLFDAIRFLSNLSTMTLAEAALSVRDEDARSTDVRSLFHRTAERYAGEMSLEAEMLLPKEEWDDLGQRAKATMTFARYRLVLGLRGDVGGTGGPGLEIRWEELAHLQKKDCPQPPAVSPQQVAVEGQRTVRPAATALHLHGGSGTTEGYPPPPGRRQPRQAGPFPGGDPAENGAVVDHGRESHGPCRAPGDGVLAAAAARALGHEEARRLQWPRRAGGRRVPPRRHALPAQPWRAAGGRKRP